MGALDRIFRRRQDPQRPLESYVKGLFAAGEQGLWYDIPGHADVLNQLGPELLVNPSFDNGLTGWTVAQPAGSTISAAGGNLSFVTDGGTYSAITQAPALTVGSFYIVRIDVATGSGALKLVGIDTEVQFSGSRLLIGRATAQSVSIARVAGVAASMAIAGVSIKEWVGAPYCKLFQDAAGTTPVYMPGQGQVDPPVGLLLDKRMPLGPELVSNGAFDSGTAGWSTSSAYQSTAAAVGGEMQVTSTAAFGRQVSPVSLTVGKTYVLSGKVRTEGGVAGRLQVSPASSGGDAGAFVAVNTTSPTTVAGRIVFTATAAQMYVTAGGVAVGAVTYFSAVSVRELPGNHAYQTTTTSRPTLSARYNLLTASENLASTWSVFNGSFSAASGYWKFAENASANLHSFLQTPSQPKAASYRASFVGKPAGRSMVRFVLNAYSGNFAEVRFDLATGTVAGTFTGGDGVVESYSIAPVGDGAYRCTIVGKPSAAAAGTAFDVSLGMMDGTSSSYTGDGVSGILVNYFDCRYANDGVGLPPYQRVVDVNTYGTAGFPLYLRFDGVDDWMQTASIDFTGTDKVTLWAAIRKLSDAARGIVCELGADVNQSFGLAAPNSAGPNIAYYSRGTIQTVASATVAAPTTAVVTGVGDISADITKIAINGAQLAANALDQGAGNLGNLPLYIGRRGGASLPFNGRIYGLIIRGAATPDPTISRVERHLNAKSRAY